MRRALDLIRRVVVGRPEQLARESQHTEWLAGEPELRQFADELRVDVDQRCVVFGHVKLRGGRLRSVGLPLERITATHTSITAAPSASASVPPMIVAS